MCTAASITAAAAAAAAWRPDAVLPTPPSDDCAEGPGACPIPKQLNRLLGSKAPALAMSRADPCCLTPASSVMTHSGNHRACDRACSVASSGQAAVMGSDVLSSGNTCAGRSLLGSCGLQVVVHAHEVVQCLITSFMGVSVAHTASFCNLSCTCICH